MKKIFINRIGRREFLKTSLSGLALATLPRIYFAQSNPDVVVILQRLHGFLKPNS